MTNTNKPPATNLLNTERTKSTSLIIKILASARRINKPKHFGQSSEDEMLVQDSAFHNFLKLFDEIGLEKDERCLKIWLTNLKFLMVQVKSIVGRNKIEIITQFSDQFLLQAIQTIEAGKFSSFNLHWSQKLRDNLSNRKLLPDHLNPLKKGAIAKPIDRPALMPSEGVLALHDWHTVYGDFQAFQPQLTALLQQGALLGDCIQVSRVLGILEPFTGEHIPPEAIQIQGANYRETLIANGLLSRNRAALVVLEQIYGSLEALGQQEIYLVEALTGFVLWLRRQLGEERLICSEFLADAEQSFAGIPHQDLCALTFSDASFDLVLCNELFEHVQDLELAFREIARVLRPGGRLVATCPLAFGQAEAIVKARHNPSTGELDHLTEQEFHGDPVPPQAGSLVYRIPAWDVLGQLQAVGFSEARMHHIVSWKHGVLGSDLPGVLVIEAER